VKPYSPANHTGTRNYRLVASRNLEVLIGEIERGEGALPHSHPGIEQVAYLLEGTADVEVGGEKFKMRPGDACFFPADVPHRFRATSEKVRVMVIYSPPYLENPANVRR
jgi:quercetin dioxygenase-like cupin family protein